MSVSLEGRQFESFCKTYLVHTLGAEAGCPFILEP